MKSMLGYKVLQSNLLSKGMQIHSGVYILKDLLPFMDVLMQCSNFLHGQDPRKLWEGDISNCA